MAPAHAFDAHQQVFKEPRPAAVEGCDDADERCFSWAEQGECKRNAGYMLLSCKASCQVCDEAARA